MLMAVSFSGVQCALPWRADLHSVLEKVFIPSYLSKIKA